MRLQQKIALVTGAAQGIGESIAREFARQGAVVIVTDINDQRGQQVVSDIGQAASYFHLDVANEQQWQAVMQQVKQRFGRLNVLVNNAGVTGLQLSSERFDPEYCRLEDWRHVHAINLDGTFLGCKAALPLMKQAPSSIINLSSRSGIVGIPRAVAYASSKAAIRNHTKSVALYCAEEGYPIRCNAICPAAIMTPIWDDMLGEGPEREAALAAIEAGIPLQHMGEPIDVAHAAVYLASDESKYVTGTELHIDGGILAGSAASPKQAEKE